MIGRDRERLGFCGNCELKKQIQPNVISEVTSPLDIYIFMFFQVLKLATGVFGCSSNCRDRNIQKVNVRYHSSKKKYSLGSYIRTQGLFGEKDLHHL